MWKAPTLWNIKCDVCKSVLKLERHNYLITGVAGLAGIAVAAAKIMTGMKTIEFLALFFAVLIVVETLCSVMLIRFHVALVPRKINKDYQAPLTRRCS